MTLWEAHKPIIRAKLFQQAASLKHGCKILFQKLEAMRVIHYPTTSVHLKNSSQYSTYMSNPIKILEVFHSNLAKLYSPSQEFDLANAGALFSHISLPTLNQDLFEMQ